jgi:glutamyl-tRNA reductase
MSGQEPWLMSVQADTASADERERLAQSVDAKIGSNADWLLLKTCHRVELYGFGAIPDLESPVQVEAGEGAVRHLMRVAAGLESAIIGEDEVLHQVRQDLAHALAARSLDSRLQRLFETAIAAGRRARAGRTASSGNLAHRAVAWLEQKSKLAGRTVVVAGAGRMGSSLAHSAKQAGADVTIASRDAGRARRLAKVYDGSGIGLADAAELVPRSAGVVVALAGIWHELQTLEGELPPIADISAPTAIPAAVRARLNGSFLGIDDLYIRAESVPRAYIDEADRVVDAKTSEYVRWLDGAR